MKQNSGILYHSLLIVTILLLSSNANVRGQWVEQRITLRPGWNAVYVEVQPEPRDCERVFADLPIESVWAWNRRFSSVQFIRDPSTLVPEEPEWLVYLPDDPSSPGKNVATNLFIVQGGRAYLIKLRGRESVNWQLKGKPVLRPIDWLADSFNLVGFLVDQGTPPTFESFFAPSPVHAGGPVYRLDPSGRWTQVTNLTDTTIEPGEAYWVYCEGQSEYCGPLRVRFEQGHSLDFGRILTEQTLRIKNETSVRRQITLCKLPSEQPPSSTLPVLAGEVPLSYWDPHTLAWKEITEPLDFDVPGQQELALRIAVRRRDMAEFSPPAGSVGTLYQNILMVTDGQGTELSLPVVARGLTSDRGTPEQLNKMHIMSESNAAPAPVHKRAGLWVGTAMINKVNFPASKSDDPNEKWDPKPTASEFPIRIIIHVDSDGAASLLQQAMLMWEEGTEKPDPEDPTKKIVDEPGRFVILTGETGEAMMSQYSGAAMRDGKLVGRRISSAAFGFSEPIEMTVTGNFGDPNDMLQCTVCLDYDDALNPFKHKYHFDHDNLDYDFETRHPEKMESYTVVRTLSFIFTSEDPDGLDLSGWGDNQLGGAYSEQIEGIHKDVLCVEGTFRLHHVSRVPVLNAEQ